MTRSVTRKVLLLLLATATARSDEAPSSERLTLVWADPYDLLRCGYVSMTRDVDAIFDDAGVEVDWRERVSDAEAGAPTVIIHLMPGTSKDFGLREHAMGVFARASGQGRIPVVHIFFANVLRTLKIDYPKSHMPAARDTMVLARALARVVSHEVVHALAPEAPHSPNGIMQARLTRTDLREVRNLRLSVESKRALADALTAYHELNRRFVRASLPAPQAAEEARELMVELTDTTVRSGIPALHYRFPEQVSLACHVLAKFATMGCGHREA